MLASPIGACHQRDKAEVGGAFPVPPTEFPRPPMRGIRRDGPCFAAKSVEVKPQALLQTDSHSRSRHPKQILLFELSEIRRRKRLLKLSDN